MKLFTRALLGLIALSWLGVGSARAAAFIIDDTRTDEQILFVANDFEGGITIGGVLLQQGLGNPGSFLRPEADTAGQAIRWDFRGSWITFGVPLPGPVQVAFTEPGASGGTIISDILFAAYTSQSGGAFGLIDGFFISDASETGLDPSLFVPGVPITTWPETIGLFDFSAPFLTARASSDVESTTGVPEAASISTWGLGVGVGALALLVRRRQTKNLNRPV